MREIVLDTETTGLDPLSGHRIIDIGCLELIDHIPTGNIYQVYVNPERDVSPETEAICGIKSEFLLDKPKFAEIVNEFIAFIGNDTLVIHNARFDIKFINHELSMLSFPPLNNLTIDTLDMARKKFPGSPASLDALCRRFSVDLSVRGKHGALVDCQLLSEVYINLIGGRQSGLFFADQKDTLSEKNNNISSNNRKVRAMRTFDVGISEKSKHEEFIQSIKGSLWLEV